MQWLLVTLHRTAPATWDTEEEGAGVNSFGSQRLSENQSQILLRQIYETFTLLSYVYENS